MTRASRSDDTSNALSAATSANYETYTQNQKREQHRAYMVGFRARKKKQRKHLRKAYRQLQQELNVHLQNNQRRNQSATTSSKKMENLRELVVETDRLQASNAALRDEVGRHDKYREILKRAWDFISQDEMPLIPQPGWRVHFPDDEPSFYFHPFSQEALLAVPNPLDSGFEAVVEQPTALVTTALGWNVYRKLKTPEGAKNTPTILRARFTKRIKVSLDAAIDLSRVRKQDLAPILLAPDNWGCGQLDKVTTRMLQEFDADCQLWLHSVPGDTIVRYFYLFRRAQWRLPDGKRKVGMSMTIVDTNENRRSRDADATQSKVQWVTEGGGHMILTEVDEETSDVVSDHLVGCQDPVHSEHVLLQWIQFVVQWEQAVLLSSLLGKSQLQNGHK